MLRQAKEKEQVLPVNLTKKQIEDSPSLNSDQPVSRQYEMNYYTYYGWPMYWDGSYMWGSLAYPVIPSGEWFMLGNNHAGHEAPGDKHLRSTQYVTGYHIQAQDGEIGHVVDFIIDEKPWAIRYLVIDTKNWWAGKHVLVSPQWIERVSWEESKVFVNQSRDIIKGSPEYTPELLNREYEIELNKHYNRQGYWADEPALNLHLTCTKSTRKVLLFRSKANPS